MEKSGKRTSCRAVSSRPHKRLKISVRSLLGVFVGMLHFTVFESSGTSPSMHIVEVCFKGNTGSVGLLEA